MNQPDWTTWRALNPTQQDPLRGIQVSLQQSVQCGCIGPQRGEPVCPCQMASVKIVDGRYVMTRDLGPAPEAKK